MTDAERWVAAVLLLGMADDAARAVDDLNKAWDEFTDCLVRQKQERDDLILKLLDELAEANKEKPA